jgi:hypothetical protein
MPLTLHQSDAVNIALDVMLREKLRVFAAKGDVLARIAPEFIAR